MQNARIRQELTAIITQGNQETNLFRSTTDAIHRARVAAWLPRALHVVMLLTEPNNSYRAAAERIVLSGSKSGFAIDSEGLEMVNLLLNLRIDLDNGLLSSVTEMASAEVLDGMLETAREFHKHGRKEGSAVLVGVVFEDTMRRLHRKNIGPDAGLKLDVIINALRKADVITAVQAATSRAAASLRTAATHAQWEEFGLSEVGIAVEFTHQLLEDHFPR